MAEPEIISDEVLHDYRWVKIHSVKIRFSENDVVDWIYPEMGDFVIIAALDEQKNVYFVREWRYAHRRVLTELPAGLCDGAATEEDIMQKARHELMQEIGFDCRSLRKLGTLVVGGRTKQKGHIFLATGLFPSKQQPDKHEHIETFKMPLDKAIEFFTTKEQTTIATMLALMLVQKELHNSISSP